MAEKQEIRANEGTADQLPRGEATKLNEAMPSTLAPEELAPTSPEEAAAPDLELADATDYEPQFAAETDDEDFITGPTSKPDEAVTTGVTAMPNAARVPPSLLRALPSFVAAASMPGTSEQMRFVAAFLAREANK